MKYVHVDGLVYCRFAHTPPVVNSRIASEYGIEAEVGVKAQYGPIFAEGKNVKLRLILENRTKRMTCHAKVDWVRDDPATGECKVGLGQLSLSDDEFRVLLDNSTEEPYARLKFTESVRHEVEETVPIIRGADERVIMRMKAVELPVELIELIDEKRGATPFSVFVTEVLRDRLADS
jgi:hypothetical protein